MAIGTTAALIGGGVLAGSLASKALSAPKPPAAPNVENTLAQQAYYNQISQFTPQGNLQYGTFDESGNFLANPSGQATQITESPFQQQFREGSEGIALDLVDQLSGQQLGGFRSSSDIEGGIQTPLLGDFSRDAQRIEDRTFEAGERRLTPVIEQERRDLVQALTDRGIPLSGEAAQKELNRFDQSVGDRRSDLAFGAIEAGRVEQNRLAQLTAALRGQEVNEQLGFANLEQQQRAQQFGEIGALGGFAAPFQPSNATQIDAAGIINQGYANQLSRNQIQANNSSTNLGFLGDVGSATLGAAGSAGGFGALFAGSDENIKENIKPLGSKNGHKWFEFEYKPRFKERYGYGVYRGVMAQEVEKTVPSAVKIIDGIKHVLYNKLGLEMETV